MGEGHHCSACNIIFKDVFGSTTLEIVHNFAKPVTLGKEEGRPHQETKSATTGWRAETSGLRVAARDMISSALRPSNGSLPLRSV